MPADIHLHAPEDQINWFGTAAMTIIAQHGYTVLVAVRVARNYNTNKGE